MDSVGGSSLLSLFWLEFSRWNFLGGIAQERFSWI